MACSVIETQDRMFSSWLDEHADIYAEDGDHESAEFYRARASEVRALTDADVLRSQFRGDPFPVRKDYIVKGARGFMCGSELKNALNCGCGEFAGYLCDKPIGDGKTCDLPICDRCRIHGTNGRRRWDFCPLH